MDRVAEQYPEGSAAALYEARTATREPFIKRAQEAAELTLPSIMPKAGTNGSTTFHSPFQSVGSRGCKNLAAKLLLALLPPNAPFFRLSIDETTEDQLTNGEPKQKTAIEEGLNKVERTVQTHIEQTSTRVTASEALLHLLVTGNGLLYIPEDGHTRLFSLSSYIVVRDPAGRLLRIITKEEVARDVLTDNQKLLLQRYDEGHPDAASNQDLKTCNIYTQILRDEAGSKWIVKQELNGFEDPDAAGTYPLDSNAYIPLRFRKVDGQDYGRGFVEENIGDLRSLEGLNMAMVEAAAGVSKMLILVNPNGLTSKKTISGSPNMAVRDGRGEDVSFMRSDKTPDLNWAGMQADRIEKRLELAFLLNSAVQRNAERVTAEEIRYVAQELDDGIGATYSILSQEFQIPLVNRFMTILQKTKKLPVLPKDTVKPQIITGLEALGRGHDLNRIQTFIASVKDIVPPDQLDVYIDISDILKKSAIAIGLDTKLVRSSDDVAATIKQQRAQALMEKAAPNVVKGVADSINGTTPQQPTQ